MFSILLSYCMFCFICNLENKFMLLKCVVFVVGGLWINMLMVMSFSLVYKVVRIREII